MQIDPQIKSRSLSGVTDLTLLAPIKRGLIPAMDSRTYESRLRMLLRTLNTSRISSREVDPTPLIADAVDRIRAIHSFRLAIVGEEPARQLLLSVAFDGGWEPYMRRIWRDLGPLLDVIFCNCDGYIDSHSHGFAAYSRWVRSAQVETEFFYNASALTVNDLHYFRNKAVTDLQNASVCPSEEGKLRREQALLEQALPALAAFYRLTDMYPPLVDTNDGEFLLRAAGHLLKELAERRPNEELGRNPTEQAALRWFAEYKTPAVQECDKAPKKPSGVQGGIINPYKDITHSCLILVQLRDAAAARDLLGYLQEPIWRSARPKEEASSELFVNLAFTMQGLKSVGLDNGTLDLLPYEFREGMAARAGILGDIRWNHPTRWRQPEFNWPEPQKDPDRIQLSSIDAIVQFARIADRSDLWEELEGNKNHPLWPDVDRFDSNLSRSGVRILSVQAMQRFFGKKADHPRGHFGFVDGISQPKLDPPSEGSSYSDQVPLGDLVLGYENSRFDPPLTGKLWDDSTFLVLRKLSQDVGALEKVLKCGERATNTDRLTLMANLMGRGVDGRVLVKINSKEKNGNDFTYAADEEGRLCPFQSHIRRANPRATRDDMLTVPRIIRRGMSYGPRYDEAKEADESKKVDRGLFFMGYNASIAEQFEVIQAWLSGSNSSNVHTYSALRDPFVGVPQDGDPHRFVFHDPAGNQRLLALPTEPPIVTLEWGLYAFVPSIAAIAELLAIADATAKEDEAKPDPNAELNKKVAELAMRAQFGETYIARLRLLEQHKGFNTAEEQWKVVLEDITARMKGVSQSVWAAIRQLHGGVLRTPYGVLVCSKDLVEEVFENRDNRYTVTGYAERMQASFGEIYLGKDDDRSPKSGYQREACPANSAIMKVEIADAFKSALEHTRQSIKKFAGQAEQEEVTVDVRDLVDEILARIAAEWFGVPDGKFVIPGGFHWRPEPTCPGHFHSPSRYTFQPNPGSQAALLGRRHGQLLKEAVDKFVERHRGKDTTPHAPLGKALFDGYAQPPLAEKLASTLIGVMMGFLPPVDGNVRGVLYEWVSDRSLWDHQLAYLAAPRTENDLDKAERVLMKPLRNTLLLRPVPELVWRTATAQHHLGGLEIRPGDRVVVSIVSATQECLAKDEKSKDADESPLYLIFGGDRSKEEPPTHACPGYKMAKGVMLGILAGLLETARLRPTLSPMVLRVSLRPGYGQQHGASNPENA